MIKLAIAQIDTVLGNVEANLEKHMARIDEAVQAKADLVVFPELSLTDEHAQAPKRSIEGPV